MIANALAASLAAFTQGVAQEWHCQIFASIDYFRASVSQTPGRMNLFNLGSYIEIRYSYYKFFELLRGGEMSIFEATMLICFGMAGRSQSPNQSVRKSLQEKVLSS